MIELFLTGVMPPPTNLLIEIVKAPVPIVEVVQLQEVVPLIDPNGCEPLRYWAAEAPYYCIDKPISINSAVVIENQPQTIKSASGLATAPSTHYPVNQCTWYVWTKRPVGLWNDASKWFKQAQRDGWATGTTPQAGAIGVQKAGNHVVYIERVDGDRVYISERNYDNRGSYREKWESASKYNYIY